MLSLARGRVRGGDRRRRGRWSVKHGDRQQREPWLASLLELRRGKRLFASADSLVAGHESGGHVYENDASGDATSVVYTNGLKLLKLTVAHKGRMNQRVGERRLGMVVIFVHALTASYINQNGLVLHVL